MSVKSAFSRIWGIYWIFAVLRLLLTLLPLGYIHPDEVFQSVEVVAGDVFGLEVVRTWEFNVNSPLRSMVLPMALFGSPLYLLKLINSFVFPLTGVSVVQPYLILLLPRLVSLVLSFSIDYCVYQVIRVKFKFHKINFIYSDLQIVQAIVQQVLGRVGQQPRDAQLRPEDIEQFPGARVHHHSGSARPGLRMCPVRGRSP